MYVDSVRFEEALDLLESTPCFVNWEGGSLPWELFSKAHVGRGVQRFRNQQPTAALQDFDAALTYPDNLGVGRAPTHEHAAAHYWRGQALASLGRVDDAKAAWRIGAGQPQGSDEQNLYRRKCREAEASDR